ncbi:MAG: rhodanese-like domain-containing protein [Lutibacter sp.]|nr:rhodanese-like domain-containing protein [Lutibacter sp.]MDT8416286.1 rhodanese-like domain-containing protein [Lutibacter sp.]
MKIIFFTITALVSIFFVNAQQQTIKIVNPSEFDKLITKKEGILLDVRTLYEFESGHIKGAEQLNYYSFSFKENLLLLPKDKPIYLYCRTGYRSGKTAEILKANGYKNVYNLQYGLKDWELKGFSISKNAQTSAK